MKQSATLMWNAPTHLEVPTLIIIIIINKALVIVHYRILKYY